MKKFPEFDKESKLVPMLELTYIDIPVVISFIEVPGLVQLPLGPYGLEQIEEFSSIFGETVENMIRSDNTFDERINESNKEWIIREREELYAALYLTGNLYRCDNRENLTN